MAKKNKNESLHTTPAGNESGAKSAQKPTFYRIVVEGRPGCTVFPTDGAKAYYIQCMRTALPLYSVEVETFSVVHNAAYAVIASFDTTPTSFRRYFDLVNSTYARYFSETFGMSGMVFKKVYVKRLKSMDDVASTMAAVDQQPYAHGIVRGASYPYCTSGNMGGAVSSQSAYESAFGAEGRTALANAYNGSVGIINGGLGSRERLDLIIEDTLIDYGCYTKRAVPNDIMHRLIAVIVENSGEPYDKVCNKLAIPRGKRDALLANVMAEMVIGLKHTFDSSYEILGADSANKRALMVDLIILLYERLGYSIDTIFGMLGFAYVAVIDGRCHYYNEDLAVEVIRKLADMKNVGVEVAINLFGIVDTFEDPERVVYMAALCRGEIE